MKARRLAWATAALGAVMAVAALILELSSGALQADPGMGLAGLLIALLIAVGLLLVVDEGAIDDQVDRVEAVTRHGDADHHGRQRDRRDEAEPDEDAV